MQEHELDSYLLPNTSLWGLLLRDHYETLFSHVYTTNFGEYNYVGKSAVKAITS